MVPYEEFTCKCKQTYIYFINLRLYAIKDADKKEKICEIFHHTLNNLFFLLCNERVYIEKVLFCSIW